MKLWGAVAVGLWLALAAPVLAQDHPLKGVALVIGESKYDGPLPALTNPRNDARAMDDLLSDLGFDVTRVLDGDKAKLDSEIAGFVDAAKDADVALVYYSGHGIEAGGADYLLPVDVDLSSPQAAGASVVPVDALLDKLSRSVPVTIMLLDACRTNGLPAGTLIQPPGSSAPLTTTDAGLAVVRGPNPAVANAPADQLGMVIGFAASPGQSALDGAPGDANSPYAAALLKHLGAGGYSFGDLLTMVSEEVYLKTGARQLPWVNSSLRRVLTFGTPLPAGDADEATIAQGRRQLLLSIAATPDATRGTVETIAKAQGVPLDALYGMLKVLGVDTTDANQLQQQLEQGAAQLKAFMAERPGAAKSDPELARLSALADEAQGEGAIDLALKYRAAASARADALDRQVDTNEANLKADRLELGATYAEHAYTAILNFDFVTAAQRYNAAYEQVAKWDTELALTYKRYEADALSSLGLYRGNQDGAFDRSIDAYQFLLTQVSREASPVEWAKIKNDMASTYERRGAASPGTSDLEAAAAALRDVLEVFTRAAYSQEWAMAEANLGSVTNDIGARKHDVAIIAQGVALFRAALEVRTQQIDASGWATTEYDMGAALTQMGAVGNNLANIKLGEETLRAALAGWDKAGSPFGWATIQASIANNLLDQALLLGSGTKELFGALDALHAALQARPRQQVPLDWANTMAMTGRTEQLLAARLNDTSWIDKAIADFASAAGEPRLESAGVQWALLQYNYGTLLVQTGTQRSDTQMLKQGIAALRGAQTVRTLADDAFGWAGCEAMIGLGDVGLGGLTKARDLALQGRDELVNARDIYTRIGEAGLANDAEGWLGAADKVIAAIGLTTGH